MDDVTHMLADGWTTYCGKARHFTISVIPIAASYSNVTCAKCRNDKRFKKAMIESQREIDAIKAMCDKKIAANKER